VLERFPDLDRDLLYVWTSRKWVRARKSRKGKADVFLYPTSEMGKIARLLWGYSLGLSPEQSQRIAETPATIPSDPVRETHPLIDQFRRVLRVTEQLTDTALMVSTKEGLPLLCRKAQQLMDSESCSLLLVEDGEYYDRRRDAEHIVLTAQA